MTKEILAIPGTYPTPLYRRTYKVVNEIDHKLTTLIHQWRFFKAGPPMRVKKYDGSEICYQGIAFSGSPVFVFWHGFIEPYIENYSLITLEQTSNLAIECQFPVEDAIEEAKNLLLVMVRRIYNEMSDTDQILRGDGINFPDKKDVSHCIESMSNFVTEHAEIEKMKKPNIRHQIFNIENMNGTNLQIGNNNQIHYQNVEDFFKKILSSKDKEAIDLLEKLLNNHTALSLCDIEIKNLLH